MKIDQRDALIADAPDIYYLTDHYRDHPYVLVRMQRVRGDVLRELVTGAYRYVCGEMSKKRKAGLKSRAG
jgi:hypothetical protein